MEFEREITVEVNIDYKELLKELSKYNFKIMEEYDIKDIYMINKSQKKEKEYLELLKNCILIRNIIESNKNTKMITYKYKEYNRRREIIKQGKLNCKIESIEEAKRLFEAINFEELIRINDHIIVICNEVDEIAIQLVNKKHVYIEIEEESNFITKKYSSIEEMKKVFDKYNIKVEGNNYFVKKAEIELIEKMKIEK